MPVVEVEYQVKVPSGRRSLPFSKAWCQQRQQVKEDCQSIQEGIERLLDVSNETEPKFSEFACWFTSSEKALRRSQKIHCEISAQALGKDGYNELEANQQTIARETQTQVQDFFQSLGLSEEGRQATSPIESQVELLAGPQPIKSKDGTLSYSYVCELLVDDENPIPAILPWKTKPTISDQRRQGREQWKLNHAAIDFLHQGITEKLEQQGWKATRIGCAISSCKKRSQAVDFSMKLSRKAPPFDEDTDAHQSKLTAMISALKEIATGHDFLMEIKVISRANGFGWIQLLPWRQQNNRKNGGRTRLKYRMTLIDNSSNYFCPLLMSPQNLQQEQISSTLWDIHNHLDRCVHDRLKDDKNWQRLGSLGCSSEPVWNDDNGWPTVIKTKRRFQQCVGLNSKQYSPESLDEFNSVVRDIIYDEAQKYDFFRVEFSSKK